MPYERLTSILSSPDKWIKKYAARDEENKDVFATSPWACKFCLVGAGEKAKVDSEDHFMAFLDSSVYYWLRKELPAKFAQLTDFNDDPETTYEQVYSLCERVERKHPELFKRLTPE